MRSSRYNINQVAELLGVSRRTVSRFRAAGELSPWICLGGRAVFPASTLNNFLDSRRIPAA